MRTNLRPLKLHRLHLSPYVIEILLPHQAFSSIKKLVVTGMKAGVASWYSYDYQRMSKIITTHFPKLEVLK
jgi:hypothetical protein